MQNSEHQTEKQMSFFEEGGLAATEQRIEPETGNEIPLGSSAEEVRDDVPAQLSEGEYVVPADVVRYFGVKFFEDLRSKAKGDIVEMHQEGRIGGEPVSEDGIPVSSEAVGMAEGGQVQGSTNPVVGMNPYGTPSFTGTTPSPAASGGNMEARQYINPQTGQIRTFQFFGGKPVSLIPKTFVPLTDATKAQAQQNTSGNTATTGTGEATGQETPDYALEGGGVADSGETSGGTPTGGVSAPSTPDAPSAPSYGIGVPGSMAVGAVVGGALSGGVMGAGLGALAGRDVGALSEAKNDLSEAVMSNAPADAIAAAEKDVKDAVDALDARGGLFGLMTRDADDVIANVTNAAKEYQSYLDKNPVTATTPSGGSGSFEMAGDLSNFAEAEAHAAANPTGTTTGTGLSGDISGMAPPGMDWGGGDSGASGDSGDGNDGPGEFGGNR